MNYLIRLFAVLGLLLAGTFVYMFLQANDAYSESNYPKTDSNCNDADDFKFQDLVQDLDSATILKNFNYDEYLSKADYCNFRSIRP